MKHFIQTIHKYIRRIGTPGSYDYFYHDPNKKITCPKCNKPTRSAEMIWNKDKKPDRCFGCYGKLKDKYFPPESAQRMKANPKFFSAKHKEAYLLEDRKFVEHQKAKLKEVGFDDWPDSDVPRKKRKYGEDNPTVIVNKKKFKEKE